MLPKLTRDKPNWWAQSASVRLAPPLQEQFFSWSSVDKLLIEGQHFFIPWYNCNTLQQKETIWSGLQIFSTKHEKPLKQLFKWKHVFVGFFAQCVCAGVDCRCHPCSHFFEYCSCISNYPQIFRSQPIVFNTFTHSQGLLFIL